MQFRNTLLLLVAAASVSTVLALPNAPGQCIGGQAAVGGSHLSAPSVTTGTLATGGMTVSVNGQAVPEGGSLTLPTGVEHTITLDVTGTNSAVTFFRGFLIRLGNTGVPTVNMVQPVDTAISAVPGVCTSAGVGGVGHNSRVDKTTASATVMLSSAAANMPLDVTAVVMNRSGVSEYYYASYTLSLEAVTDAPVTAAPVTATPVTMAPVTPAPVTMAPVTMAPVTAAPVTVAPVTMAPAMGSVTAAPVTMAPVTPAPVTMAPVTMAPITAAPVTMAPITPAPVTMAPITAAPVVQPTSSPVIPFTSAPVSPSTAVPATPAPTPTSAGMCINAKEIVATTAVAVIAGLTMLW